MEKDNNIAWKFTIILCILLFGVFLYFFVLQNRKNTPQLALESPESDNENIANDWKNIFGDLQNAFIKITK
jgi:preprotein translocase subunit SecG